jgi:hypothetical protein
MSDAEIAILGSSKLDEKTASEQWQAVLSLTDGADDNDTDNLGELDVFQALGITSLPYPKDGNGYAECLVLRNVGGRSGICVGARDTRTKIAAGCTPGDVVLHSLGPEQAAQVRCLEKKRTVAAVTRDSDGDSMAVILDGKNNKVQVIARGSTIEISPDGDIHLIGKKASILIQGPDIVLNGTVRLAGMQTGLVLMQGPPSGSPGGPASVPLVPVLGVGK